MKIEITDAAQIVGRWIFYRRVRGAVFSKLTRSFVRAAYPGGIVGLEGGIAFSDTDYPRRPRPWQTPWFEALDELEIHAVVEPVGDVVDGKPAA